MLGGFHNATKRKPGALSIAPSHDKFVQLQTKYDEGMFESSSLALPLLGIFPSFWSALGLFIAPWHLDWSLPRQGALQNAADLGGVPQ